ncbi:Uncharacterized protein Fot_21641 [Forsythia ovata]|uniref:Uncharacterized protein n=1 Tax=Forsythia ovata TaxID=205694 RepID=A0ABD1UWZ9_9LAMI
MGSYGMLASKALITDMLVFIQDEKEKRAALAVQLNIIHLLAEMNVVVNNPEQTIVIIQSYVWKKVKSSDMPTIEFGSEAEEIASPKAIRNYSHLQLTPVCEEMKPKNGAISLLLNFDDIFSSQKQSRGCSNPDSISSFVALLSSFVSNSKLSNGHGGCQFKIRGIHCYFTCSIMVDEIYSLQRTPFSYFIRKNKSFLYPYVHNMDGFFMAKQDELHDYIFENGNYVLLDSNQPMPEAPTEEATSENAQAYKNTVIIVTLQHVMFAVCYLS